MKSKNVIVLLTLIIVLVLSITLVSASEFIKKSDSVCSNDDYGPFVNPDNSTKRIINENDSYIELNYDRTENLSSIAVNKRIDNYGTYDVYIDGNQTEYIFLFNSDLLCGYKKKSKPAYYYGNEIISEDEAFSIAFDYLKKERDSQYCFNEMWFEEYAYYYDISFYKEIDGYKTDDIIRLWISADAQIIAMSEFNYKRFDSITISTTQYDKANTAINEQISNMKSDYNVCEADRYITIDDYGKLKLVVLVDIKSKKVDNFTRRIELVETIK